MFSKKATKKLTKSSPLIWHLLHNVKSRVKISSIFVALLENMNFTNFFICRGFFCDDENLRHPYVEELISTHACAAIWIAAVLFLVIFRRYLFFKNGIFVSKIVLTYSLWEHKCSGDVVVGLFSDWEKLLKLEAED